MDNPDHEEFRKLRAKLVKLVRESKTSCDAEVRRAHREHRCEEGAGPSGGGFGPARPLFLLTTGVVQGRCRFLRPGFGVRTRSARGGR